MDHRLDTSGSLSLWERCLAGHLQSVLWLMIQTGLALNLLSSLCLSLQCTRVIGMSPFYFFMIHAPVHPCFSNCLLAVDQTWASQYDSELTDPFMLMGGRLWKGPSSSHQRQWIVTSMSLPSFGDRRFLFTRTNMYHFLIVIEWFPMSSLIFATS